MSPEPGPPRRPADRADDPHDLAAGRDPIDLHPLASTLATGTSSRHPADAGEPEPRSTDAETPAPLSLGPLLRETRRRRAVTLLDVSQATRINPAYLEALEAENWAVLPAPVYVRGFARSYGRFLGLDPDLVRGLIPRNLPKPPDLEPAAGLRRSRTDHVQVSLPPIRPRPFALAAGAILLGALAVFGLFRLLPSGASSDSPAAVATVATTIEGTVAGPPDTTATVTETPASTTTVTPTPPASTPEAQVTSPAATAPAVATVPPFDQGRMPDFHGVIRGEAEQVLDDLGLSFVVIEVATDAAPAGIVFDQSPAPGDSAPKDTSVTLIVSQGPPPG
jgi:cytoskeleton protein RodZ